MTDRGPGVEPSLQGPGAVVPADRGATSAATTGGGSPAAFPLGVRVLCGAAVGAASTVPARAAAWLLVAVVLSTVTGLPSPVLTSFAAYAATSSLGRRWIEDPYAQTSWRGSGAALLALGVPAIVVGLALGADREIVLPWAAVGIAAALGAALRARRPGDPASIEADRTAFLVAAQRHPWACTVLVALVAAADARLGTVNAGGTMRIFWIAVPLAAAAVPVHLCGRSRDLFGSFAPATVGVLAAAASAIWAPLPLQRAGGPKSSLFLPVYLAAAVWCVGWSYALVRRPLPRATTVAMAWTWIAAALAPEVWCAARLGAHSEGAVLALVAVPFLFSAAAELAGKPFRAVVAGASLATVAGLLALAAGAVWWERVPGTRAWDASEIWLGVTFDRETGLPGAAASVFVFLVRHAELGALCAGVGALLRSARAVTAIPADHPVLTEGPWVTLPWRGGVSAAEAARR